MKVGGANEQIIEIEINLKFVSAKFTIVKIFVGSNRLHDRADKIMVTPFPPYLLSVCCQFFAFLFFLLHLNAKKVFETKKDISLLENIINP